MKLSLCLNCCFSFAKLYHYIKLVSFKYFFDWRYYQLFQKQQFKNNWLVELSWMFFPWNLFKWNWRKTIYTYIFDHDSHVIAKYRFFFCGVSNDNCSVICVLNSCMKISNRFAYYYVIHGANSNKKNIQFINSSLSL
jgi:hypothetical protein